MQHLIALWSGLDARRRVIVVLATAAMFASVLAISRIASAPQMALLYSGLDSAAAGDVVQALDQRGVAYEVRGGAIYVDRSARDRLRMTLAGEGLPENGADGYELLDSLSGFGTTSQMFDAAYWRAKEGELARTILATPRIRAARVHIANASGQPFRRDLKPTASVTVTMAGGTVSPAQAKALKYLVASSVAGLAPADVSVIDAAAGLIVAGDAALSSAPAANERAETLRKNVERLLDARMGPGKSVVEVSVETVTDRESIVERRVDPNSRVAISSDTEERATDSKNQGGGAVTVASNLPQGNGATDRSASSSNSQTRERVNYDVSETTRELHRAPGAIKRLSVAVLLDGVRSMDANGKEQWQPLPEDQIKALRALVASSVGFDASRGDVITLKSMPFEPVSPEGTVARTNLLDRLDIMSLVQIGVLAIVGLVLGLFVLRPILAGRMASAPGLPAPGDASTSENGSAAEALSGEITGNELPAPPMNVVSGDFGFGAEDGEEIENLPSTFSSSADPVVRLRRLIEERRDETVEILRDWMEDDGETA